MERVVTAVVTALVTLDAYLAIIEALHHLGRPYDEAIAAKAGGRDEPEQKDLWEKSRAGYGEILKEIDRGELLISDEAVRVLRKLVRELEKAKSVQWWDDHLLESEKAIWECLSEVKRLALAHLRVSRGMWLPQPFRGWRERVVKKDIEKRERELSTGRPTER